MEICHTRYVRVAYIDAPMPEEVVTAHQPLSKVMVCAPEPSVTGQWLRSTPSVLL